MYTGIVLVMPGVVGLAVGKIPTPGNIQTANVAAKPQITSAATTARGLESLPNRRASAAAAQATTTDTAATSMSISKAAPSRAMPLIHA